jgi:hypothetical protein
MVLLVKITNTKREREREREKAQKNKYNNYLIAAYKAFHNASFFAETDELLNRSFFHRRMSVFTATACIFKPLHIASSYSTNLSNSLQMNSSYSSL